MTTHWRQKLCDIISQHNSDPRLAAEIGVHRGATSEVFLKRFPLLHLHMIDPWEIQSVYTKDRKPDHEEAISRTKFAHGRAFLWKNSSEDQVRFISDGSLDFVFIDGNHDFDNVYGDCTRWLPKLKPGGLLIGHDYGNESAWTRGVKPAWDQFAKNHGKSIKTEGILCWLTR